MLNSIDDDAQETCVRRLAARGIIVELVFD